jgi:hypothetical protein
MDLRVPIDGALRLACRRRKPAAEKPGRSRYPILAGIPPTRSGTLVGVLLLHEMTYDQLDVISTHPLHARSAIHVRKLIGELRRCVRPADYVEFQAQLYTDLRYIHTYRWKCRGAAKRLQRGKRVPDDAPELAPGMDPSDPTSWELTMLVCDQVGRHLRAVGDRLAWRVFNYDRRKILALSSNAPSGQLVPSAGDGLRYEIEHIDYLWREKRHFSLMHDLTSCIRIGDITEFDADMALLHEVKKNPQHTRPAQMRRMGQAVAAANSGAAFPGTNPEARVFSSVQRYKTRLRSLSDLAVLAKTRGLQAIKLTDGQALVGAHIPTLVPRREDREEAAARLDATTLRAIERAGITGPFVTAKSGDKAARFPTLPPWAIYPLEPDTCARLICNLFIFHAHLSAGRLIEALEAESLQTRWLPLAAGTRDLAPGEPLLQVAYKRRVMTINGSVLNQLLIELIELPTWARAVAEALAAPDAPCAPEIVFANEANTWR